MSPEDRNALRIGRMKLIAIAREFGVAGSPIRHLSVFLELGRKIYGDKHKCLQENDISPDGIKRHILFLMPVPEDWIKMTCSQRREFKLNGMGLIMLARISGIKGNPLTHTNVHLEFGRSIYGEWHECLQLPVKPAPSKEEIIARVIEICPTAMEWRTMKQAQKKKLKVFGKGLYAVSSLFGIKGDPSGKLSAFLELGRAIYGEGHECLQEMESEKKDLNPEEIYDYQILRKYLESEKERLQKACIMAAISRNQGSKIKAANSLDMNEPSLYQICNKLYIGKVPAGSFEFDYNGEEMPESYQAMLDMWEGIKASALKAFLIRGLERFGFRSYRQFAGCVNVNYNSIKKLLEEFKIETDRYFVAEDKPKKTPKRSVSKEECQIPWHFAGFGALNRYIRDEISMLSKDFYKYALARNNGDLQKTAEELGIKEQSLNFALDKFDVIAISGSSDFFPESTITETPKTRDELNQKKDEIRNNYTRDFLLFNLKRLGFRSYKQFGGAVKIPHVTLVTALEKYGIDPNDYRKK